MARQVTYDADTLREVAASHDDNGTRHDEVADMLRFAATLIVERDALTIREQAAYDNMTIAIAERDRLAADNARLKESDAQTRFNLYADLDRSPDDITTPHLAIVAGNAIAALKVQNAKLTAQLAEVTQERDRAREMARRWHEERDEDCGYSYRCIDGEEIASWPVK